MAYRDAQGNPLCRRCMTRWGHEIRAYIQLVGEWLCKNCYELAVENESTYAKVRAREALRR